MALVFNLLSMVVKRFLLEMLRLSSLVVLIICLPAPMLLGISGEFTIANNAVIVFSGSNAIIPACIFTFRYWAKLKFISIRTTFITYKTCIALKVNDQLNSNSYHMTRGLAPIVVKVYLAIIFFFSDLELDLVWILSLRT